MVGLEQFEYIDLKEMDKVKLMNRKDTKYWFNSSELGVLLNRIYDDYLVMNIEHETILPYATTYFDTSVNSMFIAHHNGKLNRYKIRKRCYLSSSIGFLEIKYKNNKGRTIKQRVRSDYFTTDFTEKEIDFLRSQTPYLTHDLHVSLINNFSRITLVNKNFKERCTIDLNLKFNCIRKQVDLKNLVIVEIKSDGFASNSSLALALRDLRIKKNGFSKYCIGRVLTDHSLKRNAFKHKIRNIEKSLLSGKYN